MHSGKGHYSKSVKVIQFVLGDPALEVVHMDTVYTAAC